MTTEQEIGRQAPLRRAMPKTGTRRHTAPHQPKPRPRPDGRPDVEGKRAATVTRPETGTRAGAEDARAAARRAVPRRRPARRQRTPFVLLVVGLMSGGLVSLLLLNTMLAQDAITDATLRDEISVARQENERLQLKYQLDTQPGAVADDAEKQGYAPDWGNVNGWSTAGDRAGQVDTER
ncbi:hypothetical protein [Nonomuraea sp. SYSU D8015]|uniref:hypothetical protein n=1 Tax=Nonomuraea sp. SYSU D8015 TaxID=2593644 RepID=UPI0016603DDF|nr:hypothetical protein [Nonomuraea sp. SYSU D8015]